LKQKVVTNPAGWRSGARREYTRRRHARESQAGYMHASREEDVSGVRRMKERKTRAKGLKNSRHRR